MTETTVIAGIMHFSYNPTCQTAAFIANFATRDPGTQTTWGSLMRVRTPPPICSFNGRPVGGLKVGVRVLHMLPGTLSSFGHHLPDLDNIYP
jgi:hypothetical protein